MDGNDRTENVLQYLKNEENEEQIADQCILHGNELKASETNSSTWNYQDGWPEERWQQVNSYTRVSLSEMGFEPRINNYELDFCRNSTVIPSL